MTELLQTWAYEIAAVVSSLLALRLAFWRSVALFVSRPFVADFLIGLAMRTPYSHITSADGADVYMRRYWLFNAYATESGERVEGGAAPNGRSWWRKLLPSIRVHHIVRADNDRDLHDHPWNARTILLFGSYLEERYADETPRGAAMRELRHPGSDEREYFMRKAGDTATLRFRQFHRIERVSPGGVWTLFITWRYAGTWGFDVDGVKVPWREYLGATK